MMLLRCYTQYASKFGKLSSGQKIGEDQSTSQSQRRAVPKNAPTTAQLHSFHTLARLCLKFYKEGSSSMWIENSQYKLDLEEAEEPETKLQTFLMEKAREFQKDIYFCFIDYAKAFDCVDHSKLWQVLKEMGVPDHLICLLRNLYVGQEATVRTGYGTTDWFKIGKGVRQGCILSPCLFNLYAEFIMRKAGLDESQAGIKIAGRNINNLRYADDTTLMAESEEELKNLLMRVKEESAKYGLKLNIKKTKIMATGPITSWQIEGKEMEAVRDFTFLGSMITADGDSSHEIKRRLLLGRRAMTGLDSILRSRDVTLPTKVRIVKAMVFPVVMYGSESWTIKKADRRRIDAFELWCWRRLLRVPWTARRSNASILKEISPECSLEGQIVKLRLQYFGHLRRREDSLEKTLMLGKKEGTRRRGRQRTRWLDSVFEVTSMSLTKLREVVEDRGAWRALVHGVTKSRTRLNNNNNSHAANLLHAYLEGILAYMQWDLVLPGNVHGTAISVHVPSLKWNKHNIYFPCLFTVVIPAGFTMYMLLQLCVHTQPVFITLFGCIHVFIGR
uniref:ribonuclease H n=1 Tax=Podarcis muralis TaxID=64176 RepID=A0A670I4Q4_PODMU